MDDFEDAHKDGSVGELVEDDGLYHWAWASFDPMWWGRETGTPVVYGMGDGPTWRSYVVLPHPPKLRVVQ